MMYPIRYLKGLLGFSLGLVLAFTGLTAAPRHSCSQTRTW